MEKIAISGGIASGKSYAGDFFINKGFTVIDLDDLNKEVLNNNTSNLVNIFGLGIIANNQIDKVKIKNIVFNDKDKLTQLENFLHPQILSLMQDKIKEIKEDKVFIIVPLLYEKKLFNYFDKAIIISTTWQNQIDRMLKRDKINKDLATKILQNQVKDNARIKTQNYLPTTIIKNNTTLDDFNNKLRQIKL